MQRETIEAAIRGKAVEDAAFRADLISDPSGAIERAFGAGVPDEITLRVIEEAPDEVVLVLPQPLGSSALTEYEMDSIAGAGYYTDGGHTCNFLSGTTICAEN